MKEFQAFLPGGVIFEQPRAKSQAKSKSAPVGKGADTAKEPKKSAPARRKIIGISPAAKQLLEDANKIYRDISETDNEYSDRANRRRLSNQLVILEAEGKGGDPRLKSINSLEKGYLAAQVQMARIYELPQSGKSANKQDEEEKDRTQKAIEYLERGLQRVTRRDTSRDVFDAQMLLVNFLAKKDRTIEAAVLGEGLARNNPKMPRASVAAALAVFAYNSALAKLKESPAPRTRPRKPTSATSLVSPTLPRRPGRTMARPTPSATYSRSTRRTATKITSWPGRPTPELATATARYTRLDARWRGSCFT